MVVLSTELFSRAAHTRLLYLASVCVALYKKCVERRAMMGTEAYNELVTFLDNVREVERGRNGRQV